MRIGNKSQREYENVEKRDNRKTDRSGNPIIYQYIIAYTVSHIIYKSKTSLRRHVAIIT